MKKSAKNLVLIAIVYLFATCSESDRILPALEDEGFKKSEPKTVTVPFKASFLGTYTSFLEPGDPGWNDCAGSSFACQVGVDYVGTGTHLGKFTGSFDFCACGGPNPDHPLGFEYGPAETVMTAANGDELWLEIPIGYVNVTQPEDGQPEYVIEWWRDRFVITGGTGRFEGATGEGWGDDYNSTEDDNSHHNWTGTITMIKGKGH